MPNHKEIRDFLIAREHYLSKEMIQHFETNCTDVDGKALLNFEILDLVAHLKCSWIEAMRLWAELLHEGWVRERQKDNVWARCLKENFRDMFHVACDCYWMNDYWLHTYCEKDVEEIYKEDSEVVFHGMRSVEHVLKRKRNSERDWLPENKRRKLSKIGIPYVQIVEIQNRDLSPNDYSVLSSLDANVPRKGTDAEVLKSIPTCKYSSLSQQTNCSCMICLDGFTQNSSVATLPCDHLFHSECILEWLKSSLVCPLCKQPVSKPCKVQPVSDQENQKP